MQKFSSVEFENPEGAGDFGGIGDLLAVDPDIGPVVDAIQMQPRILAGEICRQRKLGAIPPGAAERAVFRHGLIGKKCFGGIIHPRQGAQIAAEIWI